MLITAVPTLLIFRHILQQLTQLQLRINAELIGVVGVILSNTAYKTARFSLLNVVVKG